MKLAQKTTETCFCLVATAPCPNDSSKIIAKGACSSQRANHERHREHHQPHLTKSSSTGGYQTTWYHPLWFFIDTVGGLCKVIPGFVSSKSSKAPDMVDRNTTQVLLQIDLHLRAPKSSSGWWPRNVPGGEKCPPTDHFFFWKLTVFLWKLTTLKGK